jgi:hypothetical protein
MPDRFSPREALARAFPSYGPEMYDTKMADRANAWLDRCGYQIVEKDNVSVVPPDPVEAPDLSEHANIRHQQALT